jgi:hypothetical protein
MTIDKSQDRFVLFHDDRSHPMACALGFATSPLRSLKAHVSRQSFMRPGHTQAHENGGTREQAYEPKRLPVNNYAEGVASQSPVESERNPFRVDPFIPVVPRVCGKKRRQPWALFRCPFRANWLPSILIWAGPDLPFAWGPYRPFSSVNRHRGSSAS